MTANKKAAPKRVAANWKTPGSPVELEPLDQLAHSIVSDRPDLLPSVERIMVAELDGDGRMRALTMFRDSLHTAGDANRDPRVAIASCQAARASGDGHK
jgi:hypothetical protein